MLNNVTPTFTLSATELALLGNPYTAPIDWDVLWPLQTNIQNTTHVWDPSSGTYVSYVSGTGGNSSARYIQPGQSFWIRATGAATQFNITTGARTQNIEPYLKEDGYPNLLRLYTSGGNDFTDETYIRFKEGGTPGYDLNHDGDFWPSGYGDLATEIYTVASDTVQLSVDARPMITDEKQSVPLSFKPAKEAEYQLHADEESMNSFFPGIQIMLEDTFFPEQDRIDMRTEGSYTFTSTPGDPLDRFILHFWDKEFGIEDGEIAQPIKIYSDRTEAIIVNNSEQLIKEILVYDVAGNLITNKATVNNFTTRIYVSNETGYYIVKVITDKAVYSEKVLITK